MTTVYFVTNRDVEEPSGNFGPHFSSEGLADLRFGYATVEDDSISISVESDSHQAGVSPGSVFFFDRLRKRMKDKNLTTLAYIHGYACTFEQGLKNAALLQNLLAVNVVLFSWPSDGKITPWRSYKSDRQDARASGPAIARAMLKLRDYLTELGKEQLCAQRLCLLAHSMGNYVLRHAVQELRDHSSKRLPRVFDEVILAAPDEDADALSEESKLGPLTRCARRTTVYFNVHDRALDISDWTKGNPERLGSVGPLYPTMLPRNVDSVDCTGVVHGLQEHQYYKGNERIIVDMLCILQGIASEDIPRRKFLLGRNCYRLT